MNKVFAEPSGDSTLSVDNDKINNMLQSISPEKSNESVKESTAANDDKSLETLLKHFDNDVNYITNEQTDLQLKLEYTQKYEIEFIKALAENQISLQRELDALQQKQTISTPPAPVPSEIGIFSIVSLVIGVLALILALYSLFKGNKPTKKLSEETSSQIQELERKISMLEQEVKFLKATRPPSNYSNESPLRQVQSVSQIQSRTFPRNQSGSFSQSNLDAKTDYPSQLNSPVTTLRKENSLEDKEKNFLEDFHKLQNDKLTRRDFFERYSIKTFSCKNTAERLKNPSVEPVFESASQSGDFWACKVGNVYLVVPSSNVYNDNLHMDRALGNVFESNFVEGEFYDKIVVEKVAVFYEGWIINTKGKLRLS